MSDLIWHTEKRIIKDLVPTQGNPRILTPKEAEDLKKSLEKFNLADIPVINLDNRIISGHQRVNILKSLGREKEEIDVRVPNRMLTEGEHKEYLLRANKNTGEWSLPELVNFGEGLLKEVGWENWELDTIFAPSIEDDDYDVAAEAKKIIEPKVKFGDLFEIDGHRILCGNSQNPKHIEALMGGKTAKLIFTSAPYNMNSKMYVSYKDNLKSEEYIKLNLDVINNCRKFLKGFAFLNLSYNKNSRWEFMEIFHRIIKQTGLQFLELIVWDKGHALPITSKEGLTRQYEDILLIGDEDSIQSDLELYFCGRNDRRAYFNRKTNRGITNYWKIGTNKTQTDINKACFPIGLPTKAINLMTERGNIVLDPFLGVGTVILSAIRNSRIGYGCEISPLCVELALSRIKGVLGKEPTLIGNILESQEQPNDSQ